MTKWNRMDIKVCSITCTWCDDYKLWGVKQVCKEIIGRWNVTQK